MTPILLDANESATFLGMSLRHFRDVSKRPGFPAGRYLGPRHTRWVRSELEAYALALPSAQSAEPDQLKAVREKRKRNQPTAHAPFPSTTSLQG